MKGSRVCEEEELCVCGIGLVGVREKGLLGTRADHEHIKYGVNFRCVCGWYDPRRGAKEVLWKAGQVLVETITVLGVYWVDLDCNLRLQVAYKIG